MPLSPLAGGGAAHDSCRRGCLLGRGLSGGGRTGARTHTHDHDAFRSPSAVCGRERNPRVAGIYIALSKRGGRSGRSQSSAAESWIVCKGARELRKEKMEGTGGFGRVLCAQEAAAVCSKANRHRCRGDHVPAEIARGLLGSESDRERANGKLTHTRCVSK